MAEGGSEEEGEGEAFFYSIVGYSDEDSDTPFEGFTLASLLRNVECDIDHDVLAHGRLSTSSSSVSSAPDSSDEENLPPARRPKKKQPAKKQPAKAKKLLTKRQRDEVRVNWSSNHSEVTEETCFIGFTEDLRDRHSQYAQLGPKHNLEVGATPIDFFHLLIPEPCFADMADQTNLYAAQKQAAVGADKYWTDTTPGEMKLYMYIQYMFGVHQLPNASMYWSSDPLLRVSAVADVISKNRFEKLSQYFHLNDNSKAAAKGTPNYDPLFKVRPLLDLVNRNSQAHYRPGKNLSIDEAMIKFTGRLSFKQYMKGKPTPWGIKVWCLADPTNGYMVDFDPYLGKANTPMPDGLGHHVVMRMAQNYLDKGHHLFFDNFFTSVKLAQDLEARGTYMCGTVRLMRKGWPADLKQACAKKMKPGDVFYRQDGNMLATLWKDKRPVAILSTNSAAGVVEVERRAPGGKKTVDVPAAVHNYNRSMGGVDQADQLGSYYPVGRSSVRWWRYVCWWLMQTAMVNAFLLWKMTNTPQPRSRKGARHINFRLEVLRSLCQGNAVRKHDARQFPAQAGVTSAEPLTHVVQKFVRRKKNCHWCEKQKVRTPKNFTPQTVFGCLICDVNLCKGLCFAEFHQKLDSR